MVGPALTRLSSHRAIHEAAWAEAEQIVAWARRAYGEQANDLFARTVEAFLVHVETRIFSHAEEEERGLDPTWLTNHPEKTSTVEELRHEHDTLRRMAQDIDELMRLGDRARALEALQTLLEHSARHSRHEERWLFGGEGADELQLSVPDGRVVP